MQVGQPKGGRQPEEQGHPLGSGRWTWLCGDTQPLLLLPTAWRRAGRGLGQAVLVARRLSGACQPEPLSRSHGSSCRLPARPAAPLSTALQAGQSRAGQGRAGSGSAGLVLSIDGLLLCFPLQQEGPAGGGGGGGCPGPLLCGGARTLPRHPGRRAAAAARRSLASPWQPSAGRTARCPSPSRYARLDRGSPALPRAAPQRRWVSPGAPAMGHGALHPQQGARSGAALWPPLLQGSSSGKQLSSCLSCRSCWLSCSGKGRRRRAYSAELPAGRRFGSCGRPWTAAQTWTWEASRRCCWPSS